MSPEGYELAKRIAAHPRFSWRGGMAAEGKGFVVRTSPDWEDERPTMVWIPQWSAGFEDVAGLLPDLSVDATIGVLLGMLVEVYREESPGVARHAEYDVIDYLERRVDQCKPLADVLAEALLNIWGDP